LIAACIDDVRTGRCYAQWDARLRSSANQIRLARAFEIEIAALRLTLTLTVGDTRLPSGRFDGGFETFHREHTVELLARVGRGAITHQVDTAQRDRIHAEFLRAKIQVALGRKLGLKRTEGTERTLGVLLV